MNTPIFDSFLDYQLTVLGSIAGALYILSSNQDTEELRKNFKISVWKALKGFTAGFAMSLGIVQLADFLPFMKPFVSVRLLIGFVVTVKSDKFVNLIFKLFDINFKSREEIKNNNGD
jgi:hypothetical protein